MDEDVKTEVVAPDGGAAPETTTETDSVPAAAGSGDGVAIEGDEKTTDADSDGDSGDAGKDKEGEGEASGEPLKAEDFTIPEGMELDQGMMDSFLEVANNSELSGKERDQALINLYAKKVQEASEAQVSAWEGQRKEWRSQVEAHPELGGRNIEQTKANCQSAINEYGTPEFREFCEQFGFFDNPHAVAFFNKVGATTREGTHVSGGKPSGVRNIADDWYGGSGS